jgi:fluoride ion exporter CrcB/FEX
MELFSLVSDKSFIKALIYFSLNIFISFLFFYLFHMISLRFAN